MADNDTELHQRYQAYLCSCIDHGCDCLALSFTEWRELVAS